MELPSLSLEGKLARKLLFPSSVCLHLEIPHTPVTHSSVTSQVKNFSYKDKYHSIKRKGKKRKHQKILDENKGNRIVLKGWQLAERDHHSHLKPIWRITEWGTWIGDTWLRVERLNPPSCFRLICASNVESSVPLLNKVVSSSGLDANLWISCFEIDWWKYPWLTPWSVLSARGRILEQSRCRRRSRRQPPASTSRSDLGAQSGEIFWGTHWWKLPLKWTRPPSALSTWKVA